MKMKRVRREMEGGRKAGREGETGRHRGEVRGGTTREEKGENR